MNELAPTQPVSTMRAEILRRLKETEERFDVTILMAIESGSRAWGFASPNSDYDVRFIYAHTPEWYLTVNVEHKRDVIEHAIIDDIDMNGWDVKKALTLFGKSNNSFVEWIQSPIVYVDDGVFRDSCVSLLPDIFSIERSIHHYKSMAKSNYRQYLQDDCVPLKKYFYSLRPLLSIQWIERYGTPAPVEFDRVLQLEIEPDVLDAVNELLRIKKVSVETMRGSAIPVLDRYIKEQLARLDGAPFPTTNKRDHMDRINDVYRRALGVAL